MTKIQVNSQGKAYISNGKALEAASGSTITATNKTGSAITAGDKVWVNGTDIVPYEDTPNFNVVGSPTIQNHVVSGFSTSDYLTLKEIPQNVNSFKMKFKFNCSLSSVGNHNVILGQSTANYLTPQFEVSTTGSRPYFLVSRTGASPWKGVLANSTSKPEYIWVVYLEWDGTDISMKYSFDEEMTFSTLQTTSCDALYWNDICRIGRDNDDNSIFNGYIYLDDCWIDINGERWWEGYTKHINENTITGVATENIAVNGTGNVSIVGV